MSTASAVFLLIAAKHHDFQEHSTMPGLTPPRVSPVFGLMIPTYNHAAFLPGVIQKARALGWPLMVIDDGSTDGTPGLLKEMQGLTVLRLEKNQGKGVALAAGLAQARVLGWDVAVTLDADGQHDPADAPRLLEAAGAKPDTVVIGRREQGQEHAPGRTRFGRAFSNFWIWIETGVRVFDAQSGFRAYPVEKMNALTLRSRRYGWETEALVRLIWGGVRVVEVPIAISYAAKSASHFRPFRDFFLNSCVNAFLVVRRLWPWPITRLVPEEKIIWPATWGGRARMVWDRYLWLPGQTSLQAAVSIGFGVFMGIFPVWGFQMLIAAFIAQRLHLNKVLVLAAANISLPPMIPLILYGSWLLGRGVLRGEWSWAWSWKNWTLQTVQSQAWEYLVGGMALAVLTGMAAGALSYLVISFGKAAAGKNSV